MPTARVRSRRPPDLPAPTPVDDPSILEAYLEDASGSPPGRAAGLLRTVDEAETAAFLRQTAGRGVRVLPQAARSSLTGGAIPDGDVVLSVEGLSEIGPVRTHPGGARVTAGAGVRLRDLQREVSGHGYYYPPVPTYQEAMVGGTVSTNAGGAATFKYGVTRQWVHGLRVVLFNGDLLEIERGQARARAGESFVVELSDGTELRVPLPGYRLPRLKKISAGYHSADPLDLVDLFVGSEGTLGLITEVTVDLVPSPASELTGLLFLPDVSHALDLGRAMRSSAEEARLRSDDAGPDIRAIELMDGHCLDLLRRSEEVRRLRIELPASARAAILFEMELPRPTTNDEAQTVLARMLDGDPEIDDGPLIRLFRMLQAHGALDTLELAFPEDAARAASLIEFRESVPTRVNEILAERRRGAPGVEKVGGDLIVPFDRLEEMMAIYEEGFSRRGLESAVWGHLSDGNLHPNALARDADQVQAGFDALLEFADQAARRGGCPLSEHGVGRNPIKQRMLRRFLGEAAIESMRAVKRGLDPESRFAPGVLFPVL